MLRGVDCEEPAEQVMDRVILITGPKHSGKSLCAEALEETTGGEAFDLDELVETQTGKTPRELFKMGVESFRKAEAQALYFALKSSEEKSEGNQRLRIIAAGGGLIDNSEALALITESPVARREIITVYLDVSAETAWRRILDTAVGGELPPFLNTENPREAHLALHKRRAEAYKVLADVIILAENKSPKELAGEIAAYLELS